MRKILLAENDQETRISLRKFLERLDCEILESATGADTVRLALTADPDLILIDLNLPDRSGLEVIGDLRQNEKLENIPILATSDDGKLGIELFMNIDKFGPGVIEYITKPISLNELADRLETILFRPDRKKAA